MEKSEYELIEAAKLHDEEALSRLYEMSYRYAYASIRRMLNSDDDAQDILQDAYITAFTHFDTLKNAEKFQPWLCRIALNRCKDFLKEKKPALFTDIADEEGNEPDFEDDRASFNPERQADYTDTIDIFDRIFDSLPADQRLCILMFYRDELSVAEIAETLNISEGTVKSRLNYGRQKIRAQVETMEKDGVKLYGAMPFLAWLLGRQALEAAANAPSIPFSLTAAHAAGRAAADSAGASSSAGTAAANAAAAGKTGFIIAAASHKLAIGLVAGAVAVSAITGGVLIAKNKAAPAPGNNAAGESVSGSAQPAADGTAEAAQPSTPSASADPAGTPKESEPGQAAEQETADRYAAFYQVLKEKLDTYGMLTENSHEAPGATLSGLVCAALVDFGGDGNEELFIYYKHDGVEETVSPSENKYNIIEVWGYDGTEANKMTAAYFPYTGHENSNGFARVYRLDGVAYLVQGPYYDPENMEAGPFHDVSTVSGGKWATDKLNCDSWEDTVPDFLKNAELLVTCLDGYTYTSENEAQLQAVLDQLKNI